MTIAAVFIVEKSGRKLLLLIGFGVCCGACSSDCSTLLPDYTGLDALCQYQLCHCLRHRTCYWSSHQSRAIPNVITTEMFRQSSRPPAFMVAGSVHWLSNFTVGLVFPFLERGLGAYSFIIFACICLATLKYIWVIIPETKNNTFLDTSKLFAQRNKVDIVVEAGDSEVEETRGESSEQEMKNTFL
ncbi:solute carrier family 2, facilitated glucose transporter member 5-like [Sinocyclocheilus anshuiensis]|uniref:solute carrier family 2, facilitated glucose transporter member 5-like n=1 Tax=Sinocyclocheilus anshuiensis TaxID=1608454 RepID=UPI0007B97159|nr:PREDICTED: solute carrier family 2, facilitated glucose transporter member 5-like [Sinocyclocheilus anshuiensis]